MDALEDVLSDWRPGSEVRRLDPAAPTPVSCDLLAALAMSRRLTECTDGAFDVSVGPLVALWRASLASGQLPTAADLAVAREASGPDTWTLNASRREVTLHGAVTQLDFGAIGKGMAADRGLAVLRGAGLAAALVDVGGDVALGDPPPGRDGWKVGVVPHGGRVASIRTLSNCGVATSGLDVQYVLIDGVRYGHIIDPRTGLGVTSALAATVIAPNAATADALASAAIVLGDRAVDLLLQRFPGVSVELFSPPSP
jgi:thiamine biosynthesis lipoprotein